MFYEYFPILMLITYFFISFVDAICHNSLSRCLFAARNCSICRSFYLFSNEKKQNIGVKHFVTDKADIVDALELWNTNKDEEMVISVIECGIQNIQIENFGEE